ncbi:uncharacterized protein G6M90_00g004850 [Metarhizium brunneum]|uniref:Amidase domain-containing protein n=1 Tax=Metarhizium brunneum TaxID=500148 RepID=A0A7D5YRU9_9HYPO|nr:hypothetical protein G6M90_00g004850 [Metarhizium brunneum]
MGGNLALVDSFAAENAAIVDTNLLHERIRKLAGAYHPDASLRPTSDFNFAKGNLFVEVMVADFQSDLNKYLEGTQISVIRSAKDLETCNTAHAELALPPGHPLCSLPLGYIACNGRPIGLTAIAKSEVTLLALMSAFEAIFSRQPPFSFLEHEFRR